MGARVAPDVPTGGGRAGTLSRALVAALFIASGIAHVVAVDAYAGIMPHFLPYPVPLVYLSGACEIAGGVGVLVPRARRLAGIGLVALLIAVFPANVQMLVDALRADASAGALAALWLRLPLQVALVAWVLRATR